MFKFNIVNTLILIFVLGLFSNMASAQDEYVPDELVIKLEDDVNLIDVEGELSDNTFGIVDSIEELNLYVVKIPLEELQNIQDSLSLNPNFQYVDKNYIVHANAVPNDTSFGIQTHFSLISAQQAWDVETGIPDVVIAVLDSGVEATHEDLAGKVLSGCSTLGTFNENNCGSNTNDVDGHGSGVSGTAAAQTNNGTGVAGICWGCQILPVKVLGDNGTGSVVDTIQGILFARNYALNNPTQKVVINLSLGRNCNATGISQDEQNAIDLAWAAGVLLVASAGNSATSQLQCPAAAANMIAVSATDNNNNLSDFSSFGNFVDLTAPGGSISLPHFIYNVEGGTGNGYTGWVGTSFSSPIVAGLAGLIWSVNMTLTNAQVEQILRTTADDIGSSFFFGDGKVNANAAVIAAGGEPPPTPAPTPTPAPPTSPVLSEFDPGNAGTTNTLLLTGAPVGSNVVFQYSFGTGTSLISGGICDGQNLSINNPKLISTTTTNGSGTASINVFIPLIGDGLTLYLQAFAEGASECGISNRVTQTIGSEPPPVINLVLTPLNPGIAGGTSSLTVTGAPAGESIKFVYSFNTGSSAISGGVCNGQNLDLSSQNNIGVTTADGSGVASLNVPIPLSGSGVTLHIQAHTDTGSSCATSNRVTQTL